jgi:hypothetical protein
MMLPLYRVFQRWPQARQVDGWKTKAGKMAPTSRSSPRS